MSLVVMRCQPLRRALNDYGNFEFMDEGKLFFLRFNLSNITKFHNHIFDFFKEKLNTLKVDEQVNPGYANWLKDEYEVHLPNQLRKSTFLMIFGHLEESLYLLWAENGKPECLEHKAFGLKKYKKFLSCYVHMDLSCNDDYQFVLNCQLIRNAIIHIAGRVSLSKDSEKLKMVIEQHKDCFQINNDRVNITSIGLSKFQQSVDSLIKQAATVI
ncbi:hypothetical protein [Vibrio cholerae]|uniref:hypothetical protein n=1 Tax=Vibrio cholerae TaxID=666 RepID=UPI00163C70B3|nr:hypothetical protein [Vibrio cholerae]